MANRPFAVVGDSNVVGGILTNVGNQTSYHIYPHHEHRILTLESCISFDALLKSGARYPAPKCHPGTREKAQKVVTNWLCREGEGSEKGIMWMSGAPGVGKSAIAQTVCEDLCGDNGSASSLSSVVHHLRYIDGCFFFTRGFENRENASLFPATIAFQLRRSRPSCCTAIDKAIEKHPEILSEDLPSQFRQLLTKAAQATGFLEGPVTVVIDGLDECNSAHDQVTLLELILEAVKTGNMRFFIASRPEEQIHTFFHRPDVAHHTYHVRLDEETFKASHDIKTFLRKEFARIRQANPGSCLRLPNGEEWPGERVLNHLTVKSNSQFMFPTLAIGFIDTPYFSPERQLQILLEAPPPGAFSALDNLYHKILSRQPPAHLHRGEEDLREYQDVVMGILRVIIAWSGKPLSATEIAVVLDKPPDVVQRIVRGPMRTLFKFHTSESDSPITLCHKSLRDYLLARDRSQEFFIPSTEEDNLFVAILSRRPTSHLAHPNTQDIVMDVLSFLCAKDSDEDITCSVPDIVAFLDVDSTLVNDVVNIGPTRLLFKVVGGRPKEDHEGVNLCTSSFRSFLQDCGRSGPFFLSNRRTDTLFIKAASRPPPSSSPYSLSKDIVLDILAALPLPCRCPLAINHIAALLEVDSGLVKHVVALGPLKWLVTVDNQCRIGLRNGWVCEFLGHGDRSRDFFISPTRLDPVFIRVLSKQLPSEPLQPSSPDILMGVLTIIVAFEERFTVCEIAFLLGVNPTLVEGIVQLGPTNPLFLVDQDKVSPFSPSFGSFLRDSSRSGPFFISASRMDAFLIQSLSHPPPPGSSRPYSIDVLLNILALTLDLRLDRQLSTRQIAAFLDVDCNLVERVVKFGAEKWMFTVKEYDEVRIADSGLAPFLREAGRSGRFFISNRRLDPFLVKILSRPSVFDRFHFKVPLEGIVVSVLTAVLAFEEKLTIHGIASVIGVDPVFVEGVVTVAPTEVLFAKLEGSMKVKLLPTMLGGFLQDASRSGNFFVPQSSIDTLFLRILFNGTTSPSTMHPHSPELLMDVLSVMIITEDSGPAVHSVAAFLDVDAVLVEGVVYGPKKQLFRVGYSGEVCLSTTSLENFLQAVDRAGDFCITGARIDNLFTRSLSRQLPPDPSHSHTQHILKSVLSVMAHSQTWFQSPWTVSLISAFLDVDPAAVEGIVSGPSRLLFGREWYYGEEAIYITPSLQHYLKDANRSGKFFISDKSLDPFLSRILSSPLSPAGANSRPQDVLRDVLTLILITQEGSLTVLKVAAALDVDKSLVDSVVKFGLTRLLFDIPWHGERLNFVTTSLADFLRDAERSGEFCITGTMIDVLFIRILSLPPPFYLSTNPPSKDILRGVMAVILASVEPLALSKIAALLGVDCGLVEGVVEIIPAKVLFVKKQRTHKVTFSSPFLKPFLHDPNRSGEFFIPPTITLDDTPKLCPLHPSDSPEVRANDIGHVDDDADEEMKDEESAKGDSSWQSGVAASSDVACRSPLAVQTLPASSLPKRKLSRLASSRQGSRDSANDVVASPSTPVRTKRPKTRGSFVLDSDTEEAMITEALLVDDEKIWDAEAVGDVDVPMVEDDPAAMVVDRKDEVR